MIETGTMLTLLWVHFLADFIAQDDRTAQNKSSLGGWMAIHIGIYTAFLLPFGLFFAVVNGVAHFFTDLASSKMTTKLWNQDERHWFFVVIGLDQFLHVAVLVLTIPIMEPYF